MKNDDFEYPVKILSFADDDKNNLNIKYQYCNKRVVDIISLEDFLNSPLIYGVHPLQLYYLGFDASNSLSTMRNHINNKNPTTPTSVTSRFKRIFNHG